MPSSAATSIGSPSSFKVGEWARLSDDASIVSPKTADSCTYCQCWEENNFPKWLAYHP